MTSRPDTAARRGGSAAEVARVGTTDAVSAGIVHGSDEGALSATRRRGTRPKGSGAAAKALRLEDRRRRAADAAEAALGGDRDGDGDHDASDDELALAEGRLKRRMYDRLADGGRGPEPEAAADAAGCYAQTDQRAADGANASPLPTPTEPRQPRRRTLTSGTDAGSPASRTVGDAPKREARRSPVW